MSQLGPIKGETKCTETDIKMSLMCPIWGQYNQFGGNTLTALVSGTEAIGNVQNLKRKFKELLHVVIILQSRISIIELNRFTLASLALSWRSVINVMASFLCVCR